ncbi:MAG: metallophosphoesterase family protein [Candidatus Omnitrophica bacterium]|nr:metallophosphoesterase family protein [Candidatus Omnitrophota bacterium]
MKYAVFADIHGNLEALHTALECAEARKLSRFLVLGDSVGYGANPNECLEWSLGHASLHILGNHEAAVIHEKIRLAFSDWARIAITWTAERLRPELIKKINDLPYIQMDGELALAHGTFHSPEQFIYLLEPEDAQKSFKVFKEKFGFVGHSHVPCFFTEKAETFGYLKEGVHKLKKEERYILNPGSIGQPRDRDLRLSFGILDPEELTFEIVRFPYDNKKAAQKILAEGLPRYLAERLIA